MEESKVEKTVELKNIAQIEYQCLSPSGLFNTETRARDWPILLEIEPGSFEILPESPSKCKDFEIIKRDIDRSLFSLDIHQSLSDEERKIKRSELSQIVNTVIFQDESLSYFQGFHSLCSIFYEIGDLDLGFKMSLKASQTYLKDSMSTSFEKGVMAQLFLIYEILEETDRILAEKLKSFYIFDGEVTCPIICLSWVLTWFSHDLNCFESVCRIFDFILGTHPLSPIYLSACIISEKKEEILSFESIFELHELFSNEIEKINVEDTCKQTFKLLKRIPPDLLIEKKEKRFESTSLQFNSPTNNTKVVKNKKNETKENKITYLLGAGIIITSIYIILKAGRK